MIPRLSILSLACVALVGCDWMPGKPNQQVDEWKPASAVTDFKTLYTQNCLACHSDGTNLAGSTSLNNPLYLSIIPEAELTDIITNGVKGTLMPAFSSTHGGALTEQQIGILVQGILAWKNNAPVPADAPPYAAPLGNAQNGASAFSLSCASCHGADGTGLAGKAGSVVNPAYLGLVSDQYLRTIVIAGRSDLGCPDYQHRIPGRAMTNEEISDVTAWLVSQRKNEFGQPLAPTSTPAQP